MLTTRISPKKQITIPSEIFRGLGLEIGDYLQAIIEGGKIVFSPQKMIPKDQAWFGRNNGRKWRKKPLAISEWAESTERSIPPKSL